MLPVGFKPTISAGERTQSYVLDRAATGTGTCLLYLNVLSYSLMTVLSVGRNMWLCRNKTFVLHENLIYWYYNAMGWSLLHYAD
jgi:hypothetical protein